MIRRKAVPETETRLIILYALDALGPVSAQQLLLFMVDCDLMNYFTLQLSLFDMEEQGQLSRRDHPFDMLIALTDEGHYTLDTFLQTIPMSTRELIVKRAPAYRRQFRMAQQMPAEDFRLPDGKACIRLRLLEQEETILDLHLVATPPAHLENRWQLAAQAVYALIVERLFDGFRPQTRPLPAAATPIGHAGAGGFLVALEDENAALICVVPTEEAAQVGAERWKTQASAIREQVIGILMAQNVDNAD